MSLRNQRGQTRTVILALIVALVALGISVYTLLQVTQRADLRGQLTNVEKLIERGRREMANALERPDEQIWGVSCARQGSKVMS
jgi:hypothetical protein